MQLWPMLALAFVWKHTLAIDKFTVPLVISLRRTPLLMCEEACLTERNYLRAQSVAG